MTTFTPVGQTPGALIMNMGSVQKIQISLVSTVEMLAPNTDNEVVISNSAAWDDIAFIHESASLSEAEKQVDEGSLFTLSANWEVPRVGTENHATAHKFIGKQVVVIITGANGTQYIIGSPTNPAYITLKKSVPAKASGLNSYTFAIKYESPYPVRYVG